MHTLHTYIDPAPFGGVRAHLLRGDEYLALLIAIDDRQDMLRRQHAERLAMMDSTSLARKLAMLAKHKAELREISDRINHIKQLGA